MQVLIWIQIMEGPLRRHKCDRRQEERIHDKDPVIVSLETDLCIAEQSHHIEEIRDQIQIIREKAHHFIFGKKVAFDHPCDISQKPDKNADHKPAGNLGVDAHILHGYKKQECR